MHNFQQEDDANIIDSPPSWLTRNKAPVIAGTLLVLAAGIGFASWQGRRISRENQATAALASVTTTDNQLSIAREFLGTDAAAAALLSVGSAQFEASNYAASAATYTLFLSHYPHHTLANSARLGLANALEAQGKTDEAIAAFMAVSKYQPADSYNPLGLLEAARLYKVKKNYASARQLLSDCVRDYKNTFYGQQAAEELKSIPQA